MEKAFERLPEDLKKDKLTRYCEKYCNDLINNGFFNEYVLDFSLLQAIAFLELYRLYKEGGESKPISYFRKTHDLIAEAAINSTIETDFYYFCEKVAFDVNNQNDFNMLCSIYIDLANLSNSYSYPDQLFDFIENNFSKRKKSQQFEQLVADICDLIINNRCSFPDKNKHLQFYSYVDDVMSS